MISLKGDLERLDQPVENTTAQLSGLIEKARLAGASDAAVINTDDIVIENDLAALCREPRCQNYGLSKSCPPHAAGPETFRNWLQNYRLAVVIKIDVPSAVLLSDESNEVMRLLHEVAAGTEEAAIDMGYTEAKAFAGGSCKMLFCGEHPDCRVVDQAGRCRHPKHARPSMSGFGVNVSKLMDAAGWDLKRVKHGRDKQEESTATVSALVLVG